MTTAVRGRHDGCDGVGKLLSRHRPEEDGVAEGEHPTVGGHEPVVGSRGCGRHAHHRLVEGVSRHRPEEDGVGWAIVLVCDDCVAFLRRRTNGRVVSMTIVQLTSVGDESVGTVVAPWGLTVSTGECCRASS